MAERRYQIHPAIGIARVGNAVRGDTSNDFFYIGPEFPDAEQKCMGCHTTGFDFAPVGAPPASVHWSMKGNGELAVGCERCHGARQQARRSCKAKGGCRLKA